MTLENKTILIADDDKELLAVLSRRCEGLGATVVTVDDATDAINVANIVRPDVICLDVDMPSGNGLAVGELFTSNENFRTTPIIILTGKTDHETQQRCHGLAAYYIPKSTNVWNALEPLLIELLRDDDTDQNNLAQQAETKTDSLTSVESDEPAMNTRIDKNDAPQPSNALLDRVFELFGEGDALLNDAESQRPWVLCIDDDRDLSMALTLRLEAQGIQVVNAFDGADGCRKAFSRPAEAIILDYNMPHGNGDYVLEKIRSNPKTKDVPVIVVTGRKEPEIRTKMMQLGADEFLVKPVDFSDLFSVIREHIDAEPAL